VIMIMQGNGGDAIEMGVIMTMQEVIRMIM
jgi:hypothetical protein